MIIQPSDAHEIRTRLDKALKYQAQGGVVAMEDARDEMEELMHLTERLYYELKERVEEMNSYEIDENYVGPSERYT